MAEKHLEGMGFTILRSRYRNRVGEADIIARLGNLIVFCEVKTRRNYRDGFEGYSHRQQSRMVEISKVFLSEYADELPIEYDTRYDLILVGLKEEDGLSVREHIEDAFRPGDSM